MKKLIYIPLLCLLFSCGDSAEQQAQDQAAAEALEQEVTTLEAEAQELEVVKEDIEKTEAELEKMLEEL